MTNLLIFLQSNQISCNDKVEIGKEEEEWNTLIQEWINIGEREYQFDNIEDENLLIIEFEDDFDLAGRSIHPADDENAKLTLESLVISNLEAPSFLGIDYIFSKNFITF